MKSNIGTFRNSIRSFAIKEMKTIFTDIYIHRCILRCKYIEGIYIYICIYICMYICMYIDLGNRKFMAY